MTKKETFTVGEDVIITVINCAGDLAIKGGDDPELSVKGDGFTVVEKDQVIHLEANDDMKISTPSHASVEIEQNMGDCELKKIDGSIRLENVMGDLKIRQSNGFTVTAVYGNLTGRKLAGDVSVHEVKGDVSISGSNGGVTLDDVMGDVELRNIEGLLNVKSVVGDVKVIGPIAAVGGKHHLNANGDVDLYLPADAPVTIMIDTKGEVRNRSKDRLDANIIQGDDGDWVASIGEDGPIVIIDAKGDVALRSVDDDHHYYFDGDNFEVDVDFDLGELGQLGEKIGKMFESIGDRLSSKFGPEFSEEISGKIDKAINKATSKIEKAERARVRVHPFASAAPRPPKAPKAPKPPTPDQGAQQLKILEMLEAGDISVEDATTLLKALER